jgi:hypothetical protein
VAATSFTTAALIGTALALEVQAIASPAARLRKKSVLRMNVSPEVPVGNERRFPSVPRVQRGARLIRWVSHGEHIQLHPILCQSRGGDHPWPRATPPLASMASCVRTGQGQVSPPRSLYSGTKTAGAKTRNDANYAFASRTRAIAALSSPP